MTHTYQFVDILFWIIHGIKQLILLWIPLLNPEAEYGTPPQFWLDHVDWDMWYAHLDADRRPDSTWIWYWNWAAWRTLGGWCDEIFIGARNAAVDWVRSFTGWLLYGYATFAEWIDAIHVRVGDWIPAWTTSLAAGLNDVWWMLPYTVRERVHTFGQFIDQLLDDLWDQITNYYLLFVQRVGYVYDWLVYTGVTIEDWFVTVGNFVLDFSRHPAAYVVGWLGEAWNWVLYFWSDPGGYIENLLSPTWTRIYVFARDCLNFWYNLWGSYAAILADFLADPLGWIYDRVEDELIDRW